MAFISIIRDFPKKVHRRIVAPRYHPERHYMRGFGPASAARAAAAAAGQ